jgi:NitT/TauT family transport system substrate-binding protein
MLLKKEGRSAARLRPSRQPFENGGGTMRLLTKAVVVAALLIVAQAPAQAADKMKITVSGIFSAFSNYFIAIDRGYFAQEGIEVEVIQAGGGTATPALLSGDVAYSSSASVAITAILKGAELKIVFADNDHVPYQLWSGVPAIKTLEDLMGKQVGIENRGDTHELAVRRTFLEKGVDVSTIVFTPMQSRATIMAGVTSGALAAASVVQDEVQRLRLIPNAHMIANMQEIVHTITGGGVFSDKLLKDNRPLAKRFVRAMVKGRRHAIAHPDDMVAAVMKRDPAQTRDSVLQGWKDQEPLRTKDGTISPEAQKQEIAIRSELLGIAPEKRRTPEQSFDFSLIREVNAELDKEGWKP